MNFRVGEMLNLSSVLYKENNIKIPSPGTEEGRVRGCLAALKFETLCIGTGSNVDLR